MTQDPAESGAGRMAERQVAMVLGEALCAVPVKVVREVVRLPSLPTPRQGVSVLRGVIRLRGQIVPVVDLRAGGTGLANESAKRSCVVVLQMEAPPAGLGLVGLVVDSVREIGEHEEGHIPQVSELMAGPVVEALKLRGSVEGVLQRLRDEARERGMG